MSESDYTRIVELVAQTHYSCSIRSLLCSQAKDGMEKCLNPQCIKDLEMLVRLEKEVE